MDDPQIVLVAILADTFSLTGTGFLIESEMDSARGKGIRERNVVLDQAFAQGFRDGLGLGVDLQLFVNVFQVERHGVD